MKCETPDIGDTLVSMLQQTKVPPVTPNPLSNLLAQVSAPPKSSLPVRGMFAVLAGPPGTGKSSWAAQWPSPEAIIDPRDEGMIDLIYEGLVDMPLSSVFKSINYNSYLGNLQAAVTSPSKTVICESITGMQALCEDICLTETYQNDGFKFNHFQSGPIFAANHYFQKLLDVMIRLQNVGKHVILIGHTKPGTIKNFMGEDYAGIIMGCTGATALRIQAACMNVLVLVDNPETAKNTTGMGLRAGTDSTRWMFSQANPRFPSKNRMGITAEFPFPSSAKEAYLEFCRRTKRNPKTGFRVQ